MNTLNREAWELVRELSETLPQDIITARLASQARHLMFDMQAEKRKPKASGITRRDLFRRIWHG